MNWKDMVRPLLPPIIPASLRGARRVMRREAVEWEYISDRWPSVAESSLWRGWNVRDVLEVYKAKWPAFVASLSSSQPFGISPEAILPGGFDLIYHNTLMIFAYVLALVARDRHRLTMLDWGGGIGHFYLLAQALVPKLEIEYYCKDVPVLAAYGQELFPKAHFSADESCLTRKYDLTLASASLHYSPDWASTLRQLAGATGGYLFVTRLPVVLLAPAFVFVQRPYAYGYNTEYLGWCLNRQTFLREAEQVGAVLVREFVTGERPLIARAPEQCQYRGYLFRAT